MFVDNGYANVITVESQFLTHTTWTSVVYNHRHSHCNSQSNKYRFANSSSE